MNYDEVGNASGPLSEPAQVFDVGTFIGHGVERVEVVDEKSGDTIVWAVDPETGCITGLA